MPWRELTDPEIDDLLRSQRIVRVAFAAEEERYVVSLGYVWEDGVLWGTTRRGRKTLLADIDSRVAFTVDDSASAVPFTWRSCVGEGDFAVVPLREFQAVAATRMGQVFADNPDWNRREWTEGLEDGSSVCWRIRPRLLSGRQPFDPDQAGGGPLQPPE